MRFQRCLCVSLLLLTFSAGCQKSQTPPPPASSKHSVTVEPTGSSDAEPMSPVLNSEQPSDVPVENSGVLTYINPLTPAEISAGWILLTDQETLFGWHTTADINWHLQQEAITADAGPVGLLLTEVPFADFDLSVQYQVSKGGNGGIFVRCSDHPTDPTQDCYEINIADEHPAGFVTGSLVGLQKSTITKTTTGVDWHEMTIQARGRQLVVVVDGEQILDYTDDRENWRPSGKIGLQKNSGQVAYKNVKLKPVSTKHLFNSVDLAGWREVPGCRSVIDVVNETIHVVNGPGFLETEQTFGNFILQFAAMTHAAELNSGLFFRAESGTEQAPSNGYEVQIHNGYKSDDRNQPANAGTGAIFRRVEARRVVSNDNEWATITLIADGPRIATWVQGYPVVNWLDERTPDANPRKGLRLEPGHISLQGHDPTTDISFKNFSLSELP